MSTSSPPPSASVPPQAARPRRPWYLNAALAFAWFIGAMTVLASTMTLSLLRTPRDDFGLAVDKKQDWSTDERTRLKEAFEAYTRALGGARSRVVPLAVAELLVGAGMVVFAQRAALGRAWGRQALVQMIVAHVALTGLEWKLIADVRGPEDEFNLAYYNLDPAQVAASETATQRVALVLRIGVNALLVLGLTVRGSRAFYDATAPLPRS